MIVLPAVDLKGGRCVQLVGGRPEDERVALPDPAAVARGWWEGGFRSLHVVDLDAALGSGDNRETVAAVLGATPATAQVGGGVRSDGAVEALLEAGAARVVVGTRAVDDPDWLRALALRHPDRVVVAADVRHGVVLRRGWTEESPLRIEGFLESLADLPLGAVLCTDVAREGRMEGIDLAGVRTVLAASAHPVQVSGGITTMDDLAALADAGAAGAVLGMALYTDTLDAEAVAAAYGHGETEEGA